jgi:glycosyltransferase involved in cell wall biosynthesis
MYPNYENPISGIFVHRFVKALRNEGLDILVVSPRGTLFPYFKKDSLNILSFDGIQVIYVSFFQTPGFLSVPGLWYFSNPHVFCFKAIKFAFKELNLSGNIDLVHIHGTGIIPEGYAGLRFSREIGVPVVMTIHGQKQFLKAKHDYLFSRLTIEVLDGINRIMLVGQNQYKRLLEAYNKPEKISIIGNGIDPSEIKTQPDEDLKRRYKGKKIILSIGALEEKKGHKITILAISEIIKECKDIRCVIIGDGSERKKLINYVNKLKLNDFVEFVGNLLPEDVMRYMSIADIFVLPSWLEAFGIVYLEAMASGIPIIACKGQGMDGVIIDGEHGFLVEPKDVASVVSALRKLLLDEKLRFAMGEKGKKLVLENYTWNKIAKNVINIYQDVIKKTFCR